MKKEKYIILYIIAILTALLLVSCVGYLNYKNKSFDGLNINVDYRSGRRIEYAGLNWYVVKDDGTYVTLMLASNATTGMFGKTNDFSKSNVKTFLNETWLKEEQLKYLSSEIDHGAVVLDKTSKSYVRLITKEELIETPIKNDSKTPYWTMSTDGDKLWYALADGKISYTGYKTEPSASITCYKGTNKPSLKDISVFSEIIVLNPTNTIANPTDAKVTVKSDVINGEKECYKNYKIIKGTFSEDGEKMKYNTSWEISESKESVGIRPVITVKKK